MLDNTKPGMRQKNWCFTDYEKCDLVAMYKEHESTLNYICWGNEVCPTTGRKHRQGWLQLTKHTVFNTVKKLFGGKTSLFPCKGTEEQNDKYCRKDNDFQSYGEFTTQGERTDLRHIGTMILKDGTTLPEIAELYPGDYIRYHRGFGKMREIRVKMDTSTYRSLNVQVLSGETGSGKTRRAVESGGYLIHGDDMDWWDGYEQEETLIIDEYSNQLKITKLLGILDGYQLRLAIKGGFTYANWTNVIITTNLDTLHEQARPCHQAALARRITTWEWMEIEMLEVTGNITVT